MSNGFDALMTDFKARIARLLGTKQAEDGAKPESTGARATGTTMGPPRHPLGSFRDSVGRPTENERAETAPKPKRLQDSGD